MSEPETHVHLSGTIQPWFPQAKIGIFLHWGIFAVKGVVESWAFYIGDISYPDYMAQATGFTAERSGKESSSYK